MNATSPPARGDEAIRESGCDADRDSELYLRGLIDAPELVRRARKRVDTATSRSATSHVPRF